MIGIAISPFNRFGGGESAPASSLLTGLISYWPLQTNSNDIVGSNDGTDTNIAYSSAAVFNGTSKIAFADTPEINNVQQFTISGKVKVTSLTTTNDFFSKWFYPTSGSWFIRCYSNGSIEAYVADAINDTADNYVKAAVGTIVQDVEYLVTLVFDGTLTGNVNRCKIYINSTNVTQNGGGTIPSTTTNNTSQGINLGYLPNATNPLVGTQRYVGVWNRALTDAEILELTTKVYPFT